MVQKSSLRGNYKVIDEAISGVCYYFMRLSRSLWLLAMTVNI
ncbi:RND transporter [Rickettsia sp. TH2014]|nr:RND transporter [Rickettsia sp. TH2014]